MTRFAKVLLPIATSDDGEKCSPHCPHTERVMQHWCTPFGPLQGGQRHAACIVYEREAQEASR